MSSIKPVSQNGSTPLVKEASTKKTPQQIKTNSVFITVDSIQYDTSKVDNKKNKYSKIYPSVLKSVIYKMISAISNFFKRVISLFKGTKEEIGTVVSVPQYTGQVAKKSNEHLKAFLSNEIIKNKKNKLMRDLTEPLAKKSTSVDNLFSDDKVDNSLIKLNKKQKQVWKPKVEPKFTVGNSFYKVKNIAGDTVHLPLDAAANSLKKYYQDKPAQPKASTYIEKTYSIKLDPLTAHYVDTVAPTRNEPVKTSNPFAPVLDEDKIFMCAQLNEIKV